MFLISIYSILLLGFLLCIKGLVSLPYKFTPIVIFAMLSLVNITLYMLYSSVLILVFGTLHAIVISVFANSVKVKINATEKKISRPVGIIFASIVSGTVYFIFDSFEIVRTSSVIEKVSYLKINQESQFGNGFIFFALLSFVLILALIVFGVWAITQQRPRYLQILRSQSPQNIESED